MGRKDDINFNPGMQYVELIKADNNTWQNSRQGEIFQVFQSQLTHYWCVNNTNKLIKFNQANPSTKEAYEAQFKVEKKRTVGKYGTYATINELKGHYEKHILNPDQFHELMDGSMISRISMQNEWKIWQKQFDIQEKELDKAREELGHWQRKFSELEEKHSEFFAKMMVFQAKQSKATEGFQEMILAFK